MAEEYRVLVCGSRDWRDRAKIKERLLKLPENTVIIEGGQRGADLLARGVAEEIGLDLIELPANWTRYGKPAGPRRNRRMLDLNPKLVIAFHSDIENSKGTKGMIGESKGRGVPVELIS